MDLEKKEIIFYRNGIFLGVVYDKIRVVDFKDGYYLVILLLYGECCELNFGGRLFMYFVEGFFFI